MMLSPSRPLSEAGDRTAMGGAVGATVSIVRASAAEADETFPPASVDVVVIECTPSASAGDVKLHVPPADTTAVPSKMPLSYTLIVEPGSPLPVRTGVVTEVMLSSSTPLSEAGNSTARPGAFGDVVSMVRLSGPEMADTLAAASVAVVVNTYTASGSVALVKVHAPTPLATTVPTRTPSRYTFTVELASAVPVITGAVKLVMLSPSTPLSEAGKSTATGGASGAVASIVTLSVTDAADMLPAASVDRVVIGCRPSTNVGDVKLHVPLAATLVDPRRTAPSYTEIVELASAVPVSVGVTTLVRLSPRRPVSDSGDSTAIGGAVGAIVSIVMASGAEATEVLPAASVAVVTKV